ncbi:MAG TPA: FAD-dependent oxidoreductase [Trebonia sp.]|jgi:2-polyprenyl-6-methoxyphenol hydroxylase-like FAD-dependent oxidoreductase|nr:FAD-dependent oxidoreductase [Trebonia sp.]
MSSILVIGGSVAGIAAALALADAGHEVEVLERSADALPETIDAAASWQRPTVPQGVHSHAFASLGCNLLRDRAPDVYEALLAAGAGEINLADYPPPMLRDFTRQPGDDNLRMVITRRSTFEFILRERALARPGVTLTRGATVRGLVTDPADPARVTGVRLADGAVKTADAVVDATGRRTAADSWLAAAGLPVPVTTSENCKIVYYTRYYRQLTPTPPGPLNRGFGSGGLWDSYTAVLFLGDNRTFSISVGVLPEDGELKELRHEAAFEAVIRATPLLAGWVAPGNSEPISPVYAMGSLDNSIRTPAPGQPVPGGFFPIGDAICTTNPSYGRGVSVALREAFELADLLSKGTEPQQATRWAQLTADLVRPWLEEAIANDRDRATLWEATLAGRPLGRPPAGVISFGLAVAASTQDEVIWRRIANVMMMLAEPPALYADREIGMRIGKVLSSGPPPRLPGASRADLVSAISGALAAEPAR